jgi:hypothetical protein
VDFATQYPVVDYRDRHLDDFDDFHALEYMPRPGGAFTHNDKARSWNWFAPVGCSIRATDHHEGQVDEAKTLAGTGSLQGDGDLALVLNDGGTDDIDREIDAVEFLADCDQHYSKPFELLWDLDVNGSHETKGTLAFFSAAHRDGPSEFHVPVLARHPSGGPTAQTTATITVRNVKPRLTQFRVTTGSGQQSSAQQIQGYELSVLMGLPVTVEAEFTDPGVLDRQTATIKWGDGSVEAQAAFRTFRDALGGATGTVSHTHRYTVAGSRTIVLTVRDDDGGVVSKSQTLRVNSPEEAVQMIVTRLDAIIAATADETARQHFQQARTALVGSDPRIVGGAIQMIAARNYQAAIDLILQSIASLHAANDAAAAALVPALEQVIASLSALSRL